eukprot:9275943-Pyramimonas_sp.AAC.1
MVVCASRARSLCHCGFWLGKCLRGVRAPRAAAAACGFGGPPHQGRRLDPPSGPRLFSRRVIPL